MFWKFNEIIVQIVSSWAHPLSAEFPNMHCYFVVSLKKDDITQQMAMTLGTIFGKSVNNTGCKKNPPHCTRSFLWNLQHENVQHSEKKQICTVLPHKDNFQHRAKNMNTQTSLDNVRSSRVQYKCIFTCSFQHFVFLNQTLIMAFLLHTSDCVPQV